MIVADHAIASPAGRLFARSWEPDGRDDARAPLLLVHDSLGSTDLWRDFPGVLAARTGRRVVAYDRHGFGRSDARTGPLPSDFVADEWRSGIGPVCDELGLATVVLVGHSVGGGMAISAAPRLGSRCVAVAALATQAFVEEHTLAGIRVAKAAFADPEQVERLARYHGDKARWVLDAWTETWLAPAFANFNLDDPVNRLTCPLLVVTGERDEYVSAAHAERIRGAATGPLRVRVIPQCGHVLHRECPAALLGELATFLDGIRA